MAKHGLFSRINDLVTNRYSSLIIYGTSKMLRKKYANLLKRNSLTKSYSEKYYLQIWSRLSKNPDKSTFRLFSQYIGDDPRIAPEDVVQGIIQPLLNPVEYRAYYQDKNMFDKILPPSMMPHTLLRSINRGGYSPEYRLLSNVDSKIAMINKEEEVIFVKPAIDSSSGDGVIGFRKNDTGLLCSLEDGKAFDIDWWNNYHKRNPDFIVQRGLSQHRSLAILNPTSINTIRVATYKSVVDDKPHFLNAIIRIGKSGSFVDNAHAGGVFVGIDKNGVIGKYACDQYGNLYDSFNGINFSDETHIIPDFDKVVKFAENIASQIIHARLIAQDICIEADGTPKLVEFNIRAFSSWLFQFTTGPAFAEYTDEIIQYCVEHKKEVRKVYVEPF